MFVLCLFRICFVLAMYMSFGDYGEDQKRNRINHRLKKPEKARGSPLASDCRQSPMHTEKGVHGALPYGKIELRGDAG